MAYELDTNPAPLHVTTDGISETLPGVITPLAWTTGGAAVEHALRIALCSSLQLLPWPPPDCTWALSALVDGRAHLNRDALDQAAIRAADHPRRTALRAARVRHNTERNGAADSALASAMKEGRLGQSAAMRTVDDLLLSASRLLELLFRCFAHFASATVARGRPEEGLAAAVALPRPLALWGVDPAAAGGDLRLDPERRALVDAVAISASELAATVDALGMRWADDGLLEQPADIAYLCYSELPELGVDRVSSSGLEAKIERRRRELAECEALLPA